MRVPLRLAGVVLLSSLVAGCAPRVPVVQLEAQPSPTASGGTPSATPTPTPTDDVSPTASPTPTEQTPRPATVTDRARFVAAYQPENATGLQHVATDVDGDGTEELVFAYIRADRTSHVDVAWWTGTEYEVQFADDGGPASRIDRLRADDLNADGLTELVTGQSGDGAQASVSVWQVAGPGDVVRLRAEGGCHAGSHTYGATGATFDDRDADGSAEIYATCPDGTIDRYRWEAGAYRHAPELVR